MTGPLHDLVGVDPRGVDAFAATIPGHGSGRLFGGQIAAQALTAACRTVARERPVHSLHCYFLLPGRPGVEVNYEVKRTRDGRSFSTRHVTASQNGIPIFVLTASFHDPEPGPDWQAGLPPVGDVPAENDSLRRSWLKHFAEHLDIRPVDPASSGWQLHPYWFRVLPDIGEDPALHAAMLTFVSDIALIANAREPGANVPMGTAASLDHALWFHRQPRLNDWLLFTVEPVVNIGTRGLVRGAIIDRAGQLVASLVQEALLRPAPATPIEAGASLASPRSG
jgi:acyl-CoA thioesterase-2